jgi:mannose-6-phosphate isomerase-like protein (cupin superfamily)
MNVIGARFLTGDTSLYLSAVVRPVKDGLPLAPPTFEIARFAVLPNRRHMPCDRPPASNLAGIVGGTAAHVVAAIPLKPPTRILLVDPSLATPDGERLRGVHAEIIQSVVMTFFLIASHGVEFIYTLKGRLNVRIDSQEHALASGDSMYFDSGLPHGHRRGGTSICCAIVVTTT